MTARHDTLPPLRPHPLAPPWAVCPRCRLLHQRATPCPCRRVRLPEEALPHWPLVVVLLLAGVLLAGGCVGVVWCLWQWGGWR